MRSTYHLITSTEIQDSLKVYPGAWISTLTKQNHEQNEEESVTASIPEGSG